MMNALILVLWDMLMNAFILILRDSVHDVCMYTMWNMIIWFNSHSSRCPSKGVKAKHSLWQQLCGRHGWIDTEYILYADGIVALIVGQSQ